MTITTRLVIPRKHEWVPAVDVHHHTWEEAEEIAAISDSLLLPAGTGDFIEKHRVDSAPGEPIDAS